MRKCILCQREYNTDEKFIHHLAADHSLAPITFIINIKMLECFDENSTDKEHCT